MKIGVDIDGVLADLFPEIALRVKREFKIDIAPEYLGIDYELLKEKYDIDSDWILKTLYKDEWFWARAKPYPVNIAALQEWSSRGHEIHIITGRPQKQTAIVTKSWLKRYGVPNDNLSFEPIMHKQTYIKRLNIEVMFEDMFFEANKIASFGTPCFIPRRDWNEQYEARLTNPLVMYINQLSDATYFIKEREKIG